MPKSQFITTEQKYLIWYYFIEGGDNRTSVIAKNVGLSHSLVSNYLDERIKEITDRLDSEVNERYNQNKRSEESKSKENEMLKEFTENFKDS